MLNGRLVRRTWGFYLTLLDRKHFKVKLLHFYKGQSCSRQRHKYRNELWLMLKGSGKFNSTFFNQGGWKLVEHGKWHKFKAMQHTWVLEIQYGDQCVERDIERA